MKISDVVIATFQDHKAAEAAILKLTAGGFEMKKLSVVGKGYHTEEKVVGFYSIGDQIKLWGTRGAFWGGLWGLFFGGLFLTIPFVGHVIVLGYLATMAVGVIEDAVVVGGLSALAGAFFALGIPDNYVIKYESAVKEDGYLVMAHGTAAEVARARAILHAINPTYIDVHSNLNSEQPAEELVRVGG